MKVLQIGICSAVLVVLASCSTLSTDGKRIDYGTAAMQVPTLEVPPDMTTPAGDDRYKVPQGEGEAVATYSDYSKGGSTVRTASTVLPEVQGVHMERNNAQRWLVVNNKVENVWSIVKAFWQEVGLTISSEDQAAGVMETDWAENRAKIPQGAIRSVLGKVFDRAYSSGERDQYLTRLERSKDGASTEVYITHRGMVEVFSPDMTMSKWQARANDPEMEAVMLQRLMVRFGVSEAQAASAVAAVGPIAVTGTATFNAPEAAGAASLREIADGNTIIVVNDPFDRAWRKVGLAIESAGLAIEDKDREKGIYYLRPVKIEAGWLDKLKFWKGNEDTTRRYRVNVKDGGTSSEVSITDQTGASNKVSRQMLEAMYKNINKQ